MKLSEFDRWARLTLEFDTIDSKDRSLNGVQVGDTHSELQKIAFAVDACMDSFIRAQKEGAQALFVHHGIFWGKVLPLTGTQGERVRFLMKNDISLYACHLPLDRHPVLGNNAQMAAVLGLENIASFGGEPGWEIGCKGCLPGGEDLSTIVTKLFGVWDQRINALQFGPKKINTVGIVSGGGIWDVSEAIRDGLDLFITGDASHNIYHESREAGINVLFAGHYLTEVFGVRAMAERVKKDLNLETIFVDIPTGY